MPKSPTTRLGPACAGSARQRACLFSASTRLRHPAQREFGLDDADGADPARFDLGPRLAHHGIAGIGVGDAEEAAAALYGLDQVAGLGQRRRQRLVANHVDAGLEERAGDRVVHIVRRDDGNDLDAVGALGLRRRHLAVVGVDALGRQLSVLAREDGVLGIGAEGAGDQLIAVVQPRGDAVGAADEGAAPTADHAETLPARRHAARRAARRAMGYSAAARAASAGAGGCL